MHYPPAVLIMLVLTLALVADSGAAQLQPGDLIATTPDLVAISRSTGRLTTLVAATQNYGFVDVQIAPGNRALVAFKGNYRNDPPTALVRIDVKSRAQTTIVVLPKGGLFQWHFVQDQDGSYVVSVSNALYRTSGNQLLPIASGLWGHVRSIEVDWDVGHYVGSLHHFPAFFGVMVVNRINHVVSTFVYGSQSTIPPDYQAFDQKTGALWASYGWHAILLDGFRILQTIVFPGTAGHITVDQVSSDIFVPVGDRIIRYTQSGTALLTMGPYPGVSFGTVAVWGSRKLSGAGSCRPGSTYQVTLDFPQSPHALYCAALSLSGMRPGLKIGSGTVHIVPDPLFFATLCGRLPGLTTGFAGRLDASGRGHASFRILPFVPRGTVLTFSATAWNASLPGAADLSGVLTVVVE